MKTVGVAEARRNLGRLLEIVARGERIVITKNGVPVATLQHVDPANQIPVKDVIAELKRFRAGRKLNGLTIRGLVRE